MGEIDGGAVYVPDSGEEEGSLKEEEYENTEIQTSYS